MNNCFSCVILMGHRTSRLKRTSSKKNLNDNSEKHINEMYREIVRLSYGNKEIAYSLIKHEIDTNPHRNLKWVYEKVLDNIKRDRM